MYGEHVRVVTQFSVLVVDPRQSHRALSAERVELVLVDTPWLTLADIGARRTVRSDARR
jgi:hypothetical protein